jgi:hypothetical protein
LDGSIFGYQSGYLSIIAFSYIDSGYICSFHFAELLYEKANDEEYGNRYVWFDVIIFSVWRQRLFEILLYGLRDKAQGSLLS